MLPVRIPIENKGPKPFSGKEGTLKKFLFHTGMLRRKKNPLEGSESVVLFFFLVMVSGRARPGRPAREFRPVLNVSVHFGRTHVMVSARTKRVRICTARVMYCFYILVSPTQHLLYLLCLLEDTCSCSKSKSTCFYQLVNSHSTLIARIDWVEIRPFTKSKKESGNE